MNDKELREIRRRFRPDKSNILSIKGCLVNSEGSIVARFNQPMAACSVEESEKLLSVMKKSLSGSLGTNLNELEFPARAVMEGEEHKLLMILRNTSLKDEAALEQFYERVIKSVKFEGGFAILIAHDNYDVFSYSSDGEKGDSAELFSYIICSVCPVKPLNTGLYFRDYDSSFRSIDEHAILCAPELGFMFPAFDDRAANIYAALYYNRSISEIYPDFIANVFNLDRPFSAAQKKCIFDDCLKETLGDECDFEVVKSVHNQINEMVLAHKEAKETEPLTLSKHSLKNVLESCGVAGEKVDEFGEGFEKRFGKNAELAPKSIMSVNKFELVTPEVSVKVNPDRTDLVSTQVINGVKYLLIRADEGVEVNGVSIEIN